MNRIYLLAVFSVLFFSCKSKLLVSEVVMENGKLYHNGKLYSGLLIDLGSDGKPDVECNIEDGERNGKMVFYNDDPKYRTYITKVENYKNGELDGEKLEYSSLPEYHNDVIIKETYKAGVLNGPYKKFGTEGNYVNGKKDGYWKIERSLSKAEEVTEGFDFDKLKVDLNLEGYFNHGAKTGSWTILYDFDKYQFYKPSNSYYDYYIPVINDTNFYKSDFCYSPKWNESGEREGKWYFRFGKRDTLSLDKYVYGGKITGNISYQNGKVSDTTNISIDTHYLKVAVKFESDKIVEGQLPSNIDLFRIFKPEVFERISKSRVYQIPNPSGI